MVGAANARCGVSCQEESSLQFTICLFCTWGGGGQLINSSFIRGLWRLVFCESAFYHSTTRLDVVVIPAASYTQFSTSEHFPALANCRSCSLIAGPRYMGSTPGAEANRLQRSLLRCRVRLFSIAARFLPLCNILRSNAQREQRAGQLLRSLYSYRGAGQHL